MFILCYIDPGSGSLFLQALIAGFLTLLTFFKYIKSYFINLFKKIKNKDIDDSERL